MDDAHAAQAVRHGLSHKIAQLLARLVAPQAVQVDLRLDGPAAAAQLAQHVGPDVGVSVEKKGVRIVASVTTTGPTGVEMEALTAASVAALTVYDMTKALDKGIEIQDVYLLEKTGGKSGDYHRKAGKS